MTAIRNGQRKTAPHSAAAKKSLVISRVSVFGFCPSRLLLEISFTREIDFPRFEILYAICAQNLIYFDLEFYLAPLEILSAICMHEPMRREFGISSASASES